LPDTFSEWRSKTKHFIEQHKKRGINVLEIEADIAEFVGWCADRGCKINADARTDFASEKAMKNFK